MQPRFIEEREVPPQATLQGGDGGVVPEVDLLVLPGSPQSLKEDVIQRAAAPIHAHANAGGLHGVRELLGGELRALISVEDLRPTLLQGVVERLQAEGAIERVRESPSEHIAAEPVED